MNSVAILFHSPVALEERTPKKTARFARRDALSLGNVTPGL